MPDHVKIRLTAFRLSAHTHIHAHTHTRAHAHTHTNRFTHTHMYKHTFTHAHTHTHWKSSSLQFYLLKLIENNKDTIIRTPPKMNIKKKSADLPRNDPSSNIRQ